MAVAAAFAGETVSESPATPAPEGSLTGELAAAGDRFDVSVGSSPAKGGGLGRITITGTDPAAVRAAVDWLAERIATGSGE